jgi:hypothetical protein
MPTLTDLARRHAELTEASLEWLHALVSDWQLLADLSFADLILWAPLRDGNGCRLPFPMTLSDPFCPQESSHSLTSRWPNAESAVKATRTGWTAFRYAMRPFPCSTTAR